jgi:hypothetical protein
MVLELIQSRFKGLNLNTERLKLSRVGVDLPRMLIIKNTNLIAEGSDSLLGLGKISGHCFRTTLFTVRFVSSANFAAGHQWQLLAQKSPDNRVAAGPVTEILRKLRAGQLALRLRRRVHCRAVSARRHADVQRRAATCLIGGPQNGPPRVRPLGFSKSSIARRCPTSWGSETA